jgi:hypothetical protein
MLRPVVWSFGPLVALVLAGAFLLTPSVERVVVRWLDAELASRARLVNASLRGAAAEALASPDGVRRFRRLADSLVEDERLLGVGLCDRSGQWIYRSARVDAAANCRQVTKDAEGARHVERF